MKEIELKNIKSDYYVDEAYKILRTNIEFSGEDNKVIVLTSCQPNEGKSTTALQLAMSLEEKGEKVLFIDADLRKSVLTGKFNANEKIIGLSHFLAGKAELSEVLYRIKGSGVVTIFSGIVPPNPAELLGKKRFESLLTGARKVYDHIIIDAPPLGSVIDAAIIAKISDCSILVIESSTISRKFAVAVKDQMERSGCPILGVVLNKVDRKTNGYYGKYNNKYYGKYYGK